MMNAGKQNKQQKRVVVGLSGGVDSSVSAWLLKEQGFEVEGLFMKNWEEDDGTDACTSVVDLADAQSVCEQLDIPLHQVNFAAEYWDNVFEHCLDEFRQGQTPNPDILCNQKIKFDAFLGYALDVLKADWIATGHYARLQKVDGQLQLLKGLDASKDQSYFLHGLHEWQLQKVMFPLGALQKVQVRQLAVEAGLIVHDKKDSTGICFIGERNFADFLKHYLPPQPGAIVDTEGHSIGEHAGLMYYTLGQRQGLGIGGVKGSLDAPWYVVDKDLDSQTLIVGQGSNHPRLFSKMLYLDQVHWISGQAPELPLSLSAKCRYRQQDQSCVLEQQMQGFRVQFSAQQRAITPGQSVCFYEQDRCLGGGVIRARQACQND